MLWVLLAVFSTKAQNCGSFPPATVCSQAPHGQQANCCRCLGTRPQNQSFCGGTPVNKGLIALIIAGLAVGIYAMKKPTGFDHEVSTYN